jgi:hypothetical protein
MLLVRFFLSEDIENFMCLLSGQESKYQGPFGMDLDYPKNVLDSLSRNVSMLNRNNLVRIGETFGY